MQRLRAARHRGRGDHRDRRGSDDDLVDTLERLLPRDDRYRHAHGSPGHGADHVLPALVAPSVTVPVQDGEPLLGTWQSVVLVDLNRDNPRRTVRLSFVDKRSAGSLTF